MALSPTRLDYRITLSNSDRGVNFDQQSVLVARHPSEAAEHVTLRVLAWCLLHEERLEFAPGLSERDTPDLWTRDLTGQLTTWVECGAADAEELRKVMLHNRDVGVHVVMCDPRRRDELLEAIATWKKPPGRGDLSVWILDRDFVTALARRDERRHTWSVTIVGGHAYVDADGESLDAAFECLRPLEP